MKLTKLSIPSFRSYVGVDFDFDSPRVIVAGVNGSGKTGCREAIRWALTGRCDGTDAKGAGSERLAPTGTDAVEAVVTVDALGDVRRKRSGGTHTLAVGEFTGDLSTLQRALYDHVDVSAPFLDAVLDTSHFLGLHHADAKQLVLALLDVQVPVGEETLSLDALDAAYQQAFSDRRLAKVKLRDFAAPAAPDGERMATLENIDAQLSVLRKRLGTTATDAAQVAGQRLALSTRLEQIRSKGTVEPSPREGLAEEIKTLDKSIETAEKAFEAARPGRSAAAKKAAAGSRNAIELRTVMAVLKEHRPTQGCCLEAGVPCETSKHKFNHRVKLLKAELDGLGESSVDEAEVEVPTTLTQDRTRLRGLQAAQAAISEAERVNAGRAQEIKDLEAEIAALPAPPEGAVDAEGVAVRIRKGEMLRDRAVVYWRGVETHEKATIVKEALQADVTRLEALCEELGPKGARVAALAGSLGPFQAKVNEFTERFGWTVAFTVDPWGVDVNDRPVETYSESEQFRIGIALQLAIAEVSGLSFAVIDRLDILDLKNRAEVAKMILQAPVEQVIMLATREPTNKWTEIEGVRFYRLAKTSGRTQIVESPGGA